MKYFGTFFLTIILFLSCTNNQRGKEEIISCTTHTRWLAMQRFDEGVTICRIINPWKETEALAQYLLVPDSLQEFDEKDFARRFGECNVIRTPLKSITLANACHGYLLHELGAIDRVKVMCETNYVSFAPVKQRISEGKIIDGGNGAMPNIEIILSQGCDAIWMTPFESQTQNLIYSNGAAKLETRNLKLKAILCAEYMETSPLAQAEWMKFYGALVGKETAADSLFNIVEGKYQELVSGFRFQVYSPTKGSCSSKASFEEKGKIKPDLKQKKLLPETPYQGTWYVPGGQSTMGRLYQDAGYEYPWAEDSHSGSLPLSPEAILINAQDADVWVIKYNAEKDITLTEFLKQNHFYSQIKAAQNGNIFGCNTHSSDFYDATPFRPDMLLEELKSLGENGRQKYFKRLKD